MKKAIICFGCGKIRPFSKSYAVKLTDYQNPVILDSLKDDYRFPEKKVRICKTCLRSTGYKIKKSTRKVVK